MIIISGLKAIAFDEVSGRMLRIVQAHYSHGNAMRYSPLTNLLIFEWNVAPNVKGNGGYTEKIICRLDAWFTDQQQDYIIDLIYPRI